MRPLPKGSPPRASRDQSPHFSVHCPLTPLRFEGEEPGPLHGGGHTGTFLLTVRSSEVSPGLRRGSSPGKTAGRMGILELTLQPPPGGSPNPQGGKCLFCPSRLRSHVRQGLCLSHLSLLHDHKRQLGVAEPETASVAQTPQMHSIADSQARSVTTCSETFSCGQIFRRPPLVIV